jgi:DNA topoisomerase VI subunit B
LSPLGEYNLNLGIRKVLEPTMIATARDKPGAYEGHPFIVEAAVSLGGKNEIAKEGITVVRFANRIPLLFEGGADVSTRVAYTKIRWNNYKIDHKRDKIGVFVSIVSTKIPYKGTGKEYIGDDITEIQQSVKRAIQNCCNQLKAHLTKRNALRDIKERKSRLVKYIPDVGRALFGLLDGMRNRKREQREDSDDDDDDMLSPLKKKLHLDASAAQIMIRMLDRKEVTEESIRADLLAAVEAQHAELLDEGQDTTSDAKGGKKGTKRGIEKDLISVFLMPLVDMDNSGHDIVHPLFTFRAFKPIKLKLLRSREEPDGDSESLHSVVSLSD